MTPNRPPRRTSGGHGKCLYDWKVGSRDVLACTAHREAHSVVRMLSLGHDILLEFHAHGMLTGRALEDAKDLLAENEMQRAGL
jgi:hypothetical protein